MNSFIPLFRKPSVTDKLRLFTTLFESSEVNTDLAFALLKIIHRELGNEQTRDRSAYKQYAAIIETIRFHKADMLQQIVEAWNKGQSKDPEWLTNGMIK